MKMANGVVITAGLAVVGTFGLLKVLLNSRKENPHAKLAPRAVFNEVGNLKELESFGDYFGTIFHLQRGVFGEAVDVATIQLGLDIESTIAKTVSKAAEGYLREDQSISKESKEIAFVLVSGDTQENHEEEICNDILKELEICVVTYFSFYWKNASGVIEKVISAGAKQKRLHRAVLTALRKQRYDKVLQSLSTQRKMNTLLQELKQIHRPVDASVPHEGIVTIPAESSKRCPVMLFIGGGMGAGKSTVVKEILSSSFWAGVVHNAVVVEADAFKETDVIYRHLSSMAKDDIAGTAELVHEYSTEAASSLLVAALNEGRDVVFDGTMSWEPFVLQTMAMVRDIHNRRYRMGPGYKMRSDGTYIEKYWEPLPDDHECNVTNGLKDGSDDKRRYRVEFVGVTCDAHLAVVRGLRRAIITKRAVPVKGQLRSHKMFAKSIDKYVSMVDTARIYSTSTWKGPAELIAIKEGPDRKLLIDVDTYPAVAHLSDLNTDSGSVSDLYSKADASASVNRFWHDMVLDKERRHRQNRLCEAIIANAGTSVLLERLSKSFDTWKNKTVTAASSIGASSSG